MCNLLNRCLKQIFLNKADAIPDPDAVQTKSPELKPAAVLLPIVKHPQDMGIILTKRTEHLHHHAGQICFPGGCAEACDDGPIATALRETEEEIGLRRDYVEIAGSLDAYKTGTGFIITTIVGFVKPGFSLKPDSFEVADIFEIPLDFVLNSKNHQRETMFHQGKKRQYYVLRYQERFIWGATAGILVNFSKKVQDCLNNG